VRSWDKSESSEDESGDELQEDHPFEVVAILRDMEVDLAGNTKVPMEVDGEHLTPAELVSVDLAEKEFVKHVQTLAAEANAVFEHDFKVGCTDAECKDASCIMDIVSLYSLLLLCSPDDHDPACQACLQGELFNTPL